MLLSRHISGRQKLPAGSGCRESLKSKQLGIARECASARIGEHPSPQPGLRRMIQKSSPIPQGRSLRLVKGSQLSRNHSRVSAG